MTDSAPLLRLEHIDQIFDTPRGPIKAVDDVSLDIYSGRVTCLVGESGSGKTTTARIAVGLDPAAAGRILFNGRDVASLGKADTRAYRTDVQYIHQDPYASLNPTRTVGSTLQAGLRVVGNGRGRQLRERTIELLNRVDLTPAEGFIGQFPHQLSGGQRQRVAVARALSVAPSLIVADEATSMLDVSIRSSMLKVLAGLRDDLGVGFLFITHDLALAQHFAWDGDLAIMYLGKLVDHGPTQMVMSRAAHPYTRALLDAVPRPDPRAARGKRNFTLKSNHAPSLHEIPPGCPFQTRCPMARPGLCDRDVPDLHTLPGGHQVACHRIGDIDTEMATPLARVDRSTDLLAAQPAIERR